MLNGRFCLVCGEPLEGKQLKYCCKECSDKAQVDIIKDWKEKHDKDLVPCKCESCGEVFEKTRLSRIRLCTQCKKRKTKKGVTPSDKTEPYECRVSHIVEKNAEAKAKNMTYGQLQAEKWLQEHKIIL